MVRAADGRSGRQVITGNAPNLQIRDYFTGEGTPAQTRIQWLKFRSIFRAMLANGASDYEIQGHMINCLRGKAGEFMGQHADHDQSARAILRKLDRIYNPDNITYAEKRREFNNMTIGEDPQQVFMLNLQAAAMDAFPWLTDEQREDEVLQQYTAGNWPSVRASCEKIPIHKWRKILREALWQ
jgi:hypothetical protein